MFKKVVFYWSGLKVFTLSVMGKSFRNSNKSIFGQPSGTDCGRKPRFDCTCLSTEKYVEHFA